MHVRRARRRDDRGFTLVELLVSIVILGIIAVPLANVVIDYLLNTASVSARLSESQDEQIAAAFWQQDVSSTGLRGAYDATSGTFPLAQSVNVTFPCAEPGGSTQVATLTWNQYDTSGNPTQITVAYVKQGTHLLRLQCTGTTLNSTTTLARYVNGTPTLSCTGSGSGCTGSGANVPTTISLTMNVADQVSTGQPYTVTLTGQRRQT
jgi:prepilin-type N-terminal cleavage/methylation domain-containing protein